MTSKILALALLLAWTASPSAAQSKTFTIYDPEGGYELFLSGINDAGHAVGMSRRVPGEERGLLAAGRVLTDYQYPGLVQTYFNGINNRGLIVGRAISFSGGLPTYIPFTFQNGAFIPLPPLPPGFAPYGAYGVNDAGDIVGIARNSQGINFAGFLLKNGSYTLIQVPGASSTFALGVNQDTVVGYFDPAGSDTSTGFLLRNGQYSYLSVPGADKTFASGINQRGDVVGGYFVYEPGGFRLREAGAFHFRNGQYTRIRLPRTNQNSLSGINNRLDAAGFYRSASVNASEGYVGMIVHLR